MIRTLLKLCAVLALLPPPASAKPPKECLNALAVVTRAVEQNRLSIDPNAGYLIVLNYPDHNLLSRKGARIHEEVRRFIGTHVFVDSLHDQHYVGKVVRTRRKLSRRTLLEFATVPFLLIDSAESFVQGTKDEEQDAEAANLAQFRQLISRRMLAYLPTIVLLHDERNYDRYLRRLPEAANAVEISDKK